jgi:hypothetical protein
MIETKMLVSLMARYIARAESLKEAYNAVMAMGNVEGVSLPSYEEMLCEVGKKPKDEKCADE